MTCFDVYVLGTSNCFDIQTYPSQPHPGGRVSPSGPLTGRRLGKPIPRQVRPLEHAEDVDRLILLMQSFTRG